MYYPRDSYMNVNMTQCTQCNTQMHKTAASCPSCGAPSAREEDTGSNNPFLWYKTVFSKYATFSGRARRKEYWMFCLASTIVSFVVGIVGALLHCHGVLSPIYNLVVLLPSIAVGVRRMHDTDRSGWWLLVPIANLVFACTEGTRGGNRFGNDPKQLEK